MSVTVCQCVSDSVTVSVLTRYIDGFGLNSRFPVNALCRVEKKGVKVRDG